jgi:hypothetical protein
VVVGAGVTATAADAKPTQLRSSSHAEDSTAMAGVPWHDLEDFWSLLARVAIHGGAPAVAHETIETLAVTIRDDPSREAVHTAFVELWNKPDGGRWVSTAVCGSMSALSDQNPQLSWSGDEWKKFVGDSLVTIASHSRLKGAVLAKAYSNAKNKLERLNNTWDLTQVDPQLAGWYWEACKG